MESTAPADKSKKATLENTAPVDKSDHTTFENTAPVNDSERANLENTAPVDKSGEGYLKTFILDKSMVITAAALSKSPLTVLSSDLLLFVRKHRTPLLKLRSHY